MIYGPEASAQLIALEFYIAEAASPGIAQAYVEAIVARCDSLSAFPHRGTPRDDLMPGIRTLSFRRRVTILYRVTGEQVAIVGIYYGGQDIKTAFADTD